jgi:hypothetical protein
VYDRARLGYNRRVHIDDLVVRIRRLPPAKRKKLEEMVRSLEDAPQEAASATTAEQPGTSAGLRPVRGLLRDLGPSPSDEAIDEARRELWAGFPREDLP